MEIGENNVTKKVPVLVLKTYEKAGAQKWASPVSNCGVATTVGVCVWRSVFYESVDLGTHEVYLGLRFSHGSGALKRATHTIFRWPLFVTRY